MHMLWNQHPSMHYIWMDTGWTGKLFLTGSFSSMIYMHSLRISTLFFGWMLAGPKQVKISLGLYHPWLTCFHKESVYYFGWMLAGQKNISHWVPVILDSHAFTKNQCTTQSSFKTNYIIFLKLKKIKKIKFKGFKKGI